MKYGSLFTGIGGFDLGFDDNGMQCAWQVEIDDACNRVLARHFLNVQRYRDVREVGRHNLGEHGPVDLICGGFPCQDLSVAGRRAGLGGERSGLFFQVVRIIREMREATDGAFPRYVVLENVPGLLSSNGGRDFTVVLAELAQCGAVDIGWRVLDAQYFGVAQRRRRVFIVASFREGSSVAQVLFEPEGSVGDTPPRREAGTRAASTVSASPPSRRNGGSDPTPDSMVAVPLTAHAHRDGDADTNYVVAKPLLAAGNDKHTNDLMTYVLTMRANGDARSGFKDADGLVAHTLRAEGHDASEDGTGRGTPLVFAERGREQGRTLETQADVSYVLANPGGGGRTHSRQLYDGMAVRRLTPTECERLQGFPDGWTAGESDSARYKMLGNAVCRKVATWIGKRIAEVAA